MKNTTITTTYNDLIDALNVYQKENGVKIANIYFSVTETGLFYSLVAMRNESEDLVSINGLRNPESFANVRGETVVSIAGLYIQTTSVKKLQEVDVALLMRNAKAENTLTTLKKFVRESITKPYIFFQRNGSDEVECGAFISFDSKGDKPEHIKVHVIGSLYFLHPKNVVSVCNITSTGIHNVQNF